MSSAQAIAFHSITIGDKNTWDDWHLVPTSRPKFAMPPVKTSYVDIPGGDGVIDLTTALTGRPTYGNRQGSFEFMVLNDSLDGEVDYGVWYERYSEIATYLHGKEFKAILDDDPVYFYEGRFSVNEWKSGAHWSTITINYNVGPYKKTQYSAADLWLWDPFYFGDPESLIEAERLGDVIYNYKNITLNNSTYAISYKGDTFQDTPVITGSMYQSGGSAGFDVMVTYYFKTSDTTKQSSKKYYTKEGVLTYALFTGATFEEGVTYYELKAVDLIAGTNVLHQFTFDVGDNDLFFTGHTAAADLGPSNTTPGTGVITIQNTGGRL